MTNECEKWEISLEIPNCSKMTLLYYLYYSAYSYHIWVVFLLTSILWDNNFQLWTCLYTYAYYVIQFEYVYQKKV